MNKAADHRATFGERVVFPLEGERWHGYATERLWCQEIAEGRFQLKNSPFFVFDVSAEDVVLASRGSSSQWTFAQVHTRGGHSTYRVVTLPGTTAEGFESAWQPLQELGCSFEEGPGRLRAIDVPPSVDIHAAYRLLEQGERQEVWEFEEGHCGHMLRS